MKKEEWSKIQKSEEKEWKKAAERRKRKIKKELFTERALFKD